MTIATSASFSETGLNPKSAGCPPRRTTAKYSAARTNPKSNTTALRIVTAGDGLERLDPPAAPIAWTRIVPNTPSTIPVPTAAGPVQTGQGGSSVPRRDADGRSGGAGGG